MLYTQTIPKKLRHLVKSDDFIILQTEDFHDNLAMFKCHKDMSVSSFVKFYSKRIRMDVYDARFISYVDHDKCYLRYDTYKSFREIGLENFSLLYLLPRMVG